MESNRLSHPIVLDEAYLSCPICLDYFEEPKSLPNCAHNICKACVQRLHRGSGTVVCPECRVESKLPQSGDFPTNYLLKSLVDNIPGRKESKWLNDVLAKTKGRIDTERKEALETFDVLSRLINEGLSSHGLELQEQVSKTTTELIDQLRAQEKHLHDKIQKLSHEKTTICSAQLEEMRRSFSDGNEVVAEKIANVETFLTSSDIQNITQNKDKLSEDLQNLSLGFEGGLDELAREIFQFKILKFEKAALPDCESLVGVLLDRSSQEVCRLREQQCKSSTKIFLQNLTKNVDAKSLCGLFSPLGKIHCCHLAVNDSGESLGCGMVHFEQEDSVTSSIKKMDGVLMDDKKLSVARCISSDKHRIKLSRDYTYVYVFSPGVDLTETDLRSLCESSSMSHHIPGSKGETMSVEVLTDASGKSSSLWFVGFERKEDASKAVEILNGRIIQNSRLVVKQVPQKEKEVEVVVSLPPRASVSTVYVTNIDAIVNEELLMEEFSVYGDVRCVKIIKDENGRSRGCGFLYFTSQEDAIYAATKMNDKWLVSRKLVVLYVGKTKGRNLSIKNIEDSIDEDYLRKEFSAFGDVIEVKVMRNKDNSLTGFVSFITPEEAAIAAAEMNKNILLTRPLSVVVQQSKEERQAQLTMEFSCHKQAKEASTYSFVNKLASGKSGLS